MIDPNTNLRVWAVVPAAGLSRRMGATKQVLPFKGTTMVGAVVRTLLEAGVDGVVVVTRSELLARLDMPEDARVCIATNDRTDSEMIDSVRMGLAVLSGTVQSVYTHSGELSEKKLHPRSGDGVLVLPADMPAVPVEACRSCMDAFRAAPGTIAIAVHQQRRGHPILFPFSICGDIDRLAGGLDELPNCYPEWVRLIETNSPDIFHDVDKPEDLENSRG